MLAATRYAHFSSDDLVFQNLIENGASLIVNEVSVSNGSGFQATVSFTGRDASFITRITLPGGQSMKIETDFLCDKGLSVNFPFAFGLNVTVKYTMVGA